MVERDLPPIAARSAGTGPSGPSGPAGVATSHIETGTPVTFNLNEGAISTPAATATCTRGVLLGGGAQISAVKAAIHSSYPTSAGAGGTWAADAIGTGQGSSGSGTITAYVVCSGV
jgi:hypothetical protein